MCVVTRNRALFLKAATFRQLRSGPNRCSPGSEESFRTAAPGPRSAWSPTVAVRPLAHGRGSPKQTFGSRVGSARSAVFANMTVGLHLRARDILQVRN